MKISPPKFTTFCIFLTISINVNASFDFLFSSSMHKTLGDAKRDCIYFTEPYGYDNPNIVEPGDCYYQSFFTETCFDLELNPSLSQVPDANDYHAIFGNIWTKDSDWNELMHDHCFYFPKTKTLPPKYYESYDIAYSGCQLIGEDIYGSKANPYGTFLGCYAHDYYQRTTHDCFYDEFRNETHPNAKLYNKALVALSDAKYNANWDLDYKNCHYYDRREKCSLGINADTGKCNLPSEISISKHLGKDPCSIGNPISISTGNKFQIEKIFYSPAPLTLSYNSSTDKWLDNFQQQILSISSTEKLLIRSDSKGLTFNQSNAEWTPDADIFYRLSDLGSGNPARWHVTTPEGAVELYDEQGRLLSITTLQGNSTTLTYSGQTTTVTNHLGDTLQLTYDSNDHLISALLNNEINHNFNFDSDDRLLNRTDHNGNTTQYHYEDTRFPNHLTGITGPDGIRFATWDYDDQGRGIMSEHAAKERGELVFNDNGSTTVTSPLGKQTTYHFETIEGLKRPTRIEGHATSNCIGANKAFSYYSSGLLKTKTDWTGTTTRYEYNDRGQITRIVEAQGTTQERVTIQIWDTTKPLLIEKTQGNQRTLFNYDDNNQLIDTTQDSIQ